MAERLYANDHLLMITSLVASFYFIRKKDNVEKVLEGLECGIGLTDYKDIKEGDVIEILGEVEIKS